MRLGEVRQGPDGSVYQLVQGVDGLGNPVKFWQKRRQGGLRTAQRIARSTPIVQAASRLVPVAKRMSRLHAARVLQRAGMSGYIGLGELYETPDGSVYQVQEVADDGYINGFSGLGQEDLVEMMGIGYLGEVRQGPDGNTYQWVQGIDGLGNPVGFWKRIKRAAKRIGKGIRKVVGKVLPIAQRIAPFIPGVGPAVAAGLRVATPILKKAKLAGYEGLGALYEAENGTLYQMQGFNQADEDLYGLAEDEEELEGLADYEQMNVLADEELEGFADDEQEGFIDEEEMAGLGQGYVMQDQMNGLAAYIPEQPPATRWFREPCQTPKTWEAPW